MTIYYTDARTQQALQNKKIVARVNRLLGIRSQEDFQAVARGRQTEQYGDPYQSKTAKITFYGVRDNGAGRVICAVVVNKKTKERHCFALEVTDTHDYGKTLVDNPARRQSWEAQIEYFILTSPQAPATPQQASVASAVEPQQLIVHKGQFRVADRYQKIIIGDLSIHHRAMCFGPPGTGKSFTAIAACMQRAATEQRVLYVTPTDWLADDIREEFTPVTDAIENPKVISYEGVLNLMHVHFPRLQLLNNNTPPLPEVDFNYFLQWCRENLQKKPALINIDKHPYLAMALWQEFCYVIMQPNDTDSPYLNLETYNALGDNQATFSDDERNHWYTAAFKPFLNYLEKEQPYFPILVAHRLYNALKEGVPDSLRCDFLAVDEIQKFHPLQGLCLLQLVEGGVRGNFMLCGDAHQGVQSQPLTLTTPYIAACSKQFADIRIYHLPYNHRNPENIARVVHDLSQVEQRLLGSYERNTHVMPAKDTPPTAPGGQIQCILDCEESRRRIANDANAYVVVPNQAWCEKATEAGWPANQIATVEGVAGISAATVVMLGFEEEFKLELNALHHEWLNKGFQLVDEPAEFRRVKGLDDTRHAKRYCMQALTTAASRATQELSLVTTAQPHPLIAMIIANPEPSQPAPAAAALSAQAQAPTPEKAPSTLEEWFKRAEHDFKRGLQEQAWNTLLNEHLWGSEKVAALTALRSQGKKNKALFTGIKAILFPPEKTLADETPCEDNVTGILATAAGIATTAQGRKPSAQQLSKRDKADIDAGVLFLQSLLFPLSESTARPDKNFTEVINALNTQRPAITFDQFLSWKCGTNNKSVMDLLLTDANSARIFLKQFINTPSSAHLAVELSTKTVSTLANKYDEWDTFKIITKKLARLSHVVRGVNHPSCLLIDFFTQMNDRLAVYHLINLGAVVTPIEAEPNILVKAVEIGNPELVSLLLQSGASTKAHVFSSEQPLMRAIRQHKTELVRLLLEWNASTILILDASSNLANYFPNVDPQILETLKQSVKIDPQTNTPIIEIEATKYAVLMKNTGITIMLEEHKRKEIEDKLALHIATEPVANFEGNIGKLDICFRDNASPALLSAIFSVELTLSDDSQTKTTLSQYLYTHPEHQRTFVEFIQSKPRTTIQWANIPFDKVISDGKTLQTMMLLQAAIGRKSTPGNDHSIRFLPPPSAKKGGGDEQIHNSAGF